MTGDLLPAKVLCAQVIPNVSEALAAALELPDGWRAIGVITADSDDVLYCALDEATKAARVTVAYGKSLYAGAPNATTKLAGEVIAVLAGPDPEEVKGGIGAVEEFVAHNGFRSANADDSVPYFAHTVASTGSYLSKTAGVEQGTSLAYLIAPPAEAVVGLDEALKAADVKLRTFYGPPSETNFGGGLLSGDQAACRAACRAFAAAVEDVARKSDGGV